jgi:uncharacterized repeat protein (TIGR01451 family)
MNHLPGGELGFRQAGHGRRTLAVLSSVMVTAVQGARRRRALRSALAVAVTSLGLAVPWAAIAPSPASAAPPPDVTVTIQPLTDPVLAGRQVRLHIVVANVGDDVATDTALEVTLPIGLTAASVAPASCDLATLTCSFGDVLPSESFDVYLDVDTETSLLGTVVVDAVVSTSSSQPLVNEPDSASLSVDVGANADVYPLAEATFTTATAGETAAIDVTISTVGSSTADDVGVDIEVPAGVAVASVSGAAACAPAPLLLQCVIGDMPPGAPVVLHVVFDVAPSVEDGTVLSFGASTSTSTTTDNLGNNTSTTIVTVGRTADLQLDATALDAIAGSSSAFTVSVTNNGPSDAADVIVSSDLPPGFTPLAVDRAECSIVGDFVSCDFGTLAPASARSVVITGAVHADQDAGLLLNSPVATTTSNDPSPATDTASMNVTREADVSIAKTGGGAAVPGVPGAATWTIVVHNAGPSSATAVRIADTLPASVGLGQVSGACTVLPCTIDTLQPGDEVTIEVTGTVDAAFGTGIDVVTNVAEITASAERDPTTDDWEASADVVTTPLAALVVTTAAPSTIVAGTGIAWTVHLVNLGPSWARSVTINDPRPAGLTGITSVTGACTAVPCVVGDLAPGASADLSITATVAPSYALPTITNVASVTSTTPAASGSVRSASVATSVAVVADLEVLEELLGVMRAGDVGEIRVSVINHGPSDSGTVVIDTPTPIETSFVSATGPLGSCVVSLCAVGVVAAGQVAELVVARAINPGYSSDTITQLASASAGTFDPGVYANEASVTGNIVRAADLAFSIVPTSPVVPGRRVAFAATVHNAGPSDAVAATVRLTLPAALTNTSIVGSAGACTISGSLASCNLPVTTAGSDVVVVVSGDLASGVVGPLDISGAVVARTRDPNMADNDVSHSVASSPRVDVTVDFDAGGGLVAGSVTPVLALVTNLGPSVAHDVVVRIELPVDVALAGVPTAFGDPAPCSVVGRIVTCSVGSVDVGVPTPVLLPVRIAPGFQGIAMLPATVSTSTDQAGAIANDQVDGLLAVGIVADLALGLASPASAEIGDSVTSHLVAWNSGPSTAVNVELVYSLPTELEAVSAEASAGSCSINDQTVTCTVDRLELDESVTVDIRAVVRAKGRLLSTATVHSDSLDAIASNNAASTVLDIVRYADLRIVKTVDQASAAVGDELVYRISVSNYGPDDADGVVVIDEIVAGLRFGSADATQGLFDRGSMRWSVGALQNGSTVVLTVRSTVTATGLLVSRARVESNSMDQYPASDTDEVGVIVAGDRLPATGASIGALVRFATLSVGSGLVLLGAARRRRRHWMTPRTMP